MLAQGNNSHGRDGVGKMRVQTANGELRSSFSLIHSPFFSIHTVPLTDTPGLTALGCNQAQPPPPGYVSHRRKKWPSSCCKHLEQSVQPCRPTFLPTSRQRSGGNLIATSLDPSSVKSNNQSQMTPPFRAETTIFIASPTGEALEMGAILLGCEGSALNLCLLSSLTRQLTGNAMSSTLVGVAMMAA